jgi:hypothetical protein
MLTEGLKLARDAGTLNEEPFLLVNVALVHETCGSLEEAEQAADQARASAVQHGEPMIEAAARLAVARIAARRSRVRLLSEVHAALAIAKRLKSMPLRVQCLSTAGVVLAAGGDVSSGVALVRWAMTYPDFARSEREDAERHLAALGLSDAAFDPLPADLAAEDLVARLPLA